jgi:MATE family multidrug resistance protein
VGQAIGQKKPGVARVNGYIGMGLACLFVSGSAIAFLSVPRWILSFYTNNEAVLSLGIKLLAIAALFQLFDGIQTVATGALRGLGNTQLPMLVNFVGYWLFGLPIGYVLCFQNHYGVAGLWWGLTLALVMISLILLLAWQRQSRAIQVVGSP